MPDPTQLVQAHHPRRCVVTASGNLASLVEAAVNVQRGGLGTAIRPRIIGFRVVAASADFTVANADTTGAITITTARIPYDCPATKGLEETIVGGGATLGVEVFLDKPTN